MHECYGGDAGRHRRDPVRDAAPVHSRTMERRIFGLENEYGVTCTLRGQRRLSPDEVARYLFRRVVSWGRSSNVFLENGARLYLDVGSHPEYATPECDSIHDLVVHDKAGERILEGLVQSAEQRLREEGIRGEVYLFKNNTDSRRQLLRLPRELPRRARRRLRQVHRRAHPVPRHPPDLRRRRQGAADRTGRDVLHRASAPSTSGKACRRPPPGRRPIINTRDEPHADAERFRRLHVIVGDSNMSEYATFLKVGADVDHAAHARGGRRAVLRDLTLENPIRAIREISHDITCRRRVRLANGRELSARRHPGRVPQPGAAVRRSATGCRRSSSRRSRCGST